LFFKLSYQKWLSLNSIGKTTQLLGSEAQNFQETSKQLLSPKKSTKVATETESSVIAETMKIKTALSLKLHPRPEQLEAQPIV